MKIKSADFVISAVSSAQYPEDNLPEIAFAGRSNVGKSSLINMLVNRKKLARTSSTFSARPTPPMVPGPATTWLTLLRAGP